MQQATATAGAGNAGASFSDRVSVDWVGSIAGSVSAIAAVTAVFFACWAIFEAKRLREAQTSPELAVYLERNHRLDSAIDIIISNIGVSPAIDVKFCFPGNPLPTKWMPFESMYILNHGAGYLAPKQVFRFSLSTFNEIPKEEVQVEVTYRSITDKPADSPRSASFVLRPKEFEGFADWQDREREALIATKEGWDALRKGQVAIRLKE